MEKIDYDKIVNTITERVLAKIETRLQDISKRLEGIDQLIGYVRGDMDDDRKDIAKIKTDMAGILQSQKEVFDIFPRNKRDIEQTTKDTIKSELDGVSSQIVKDVKPTISKHFKNLIKLNKKGTPNKKWYMPF